jgi:hypothetical protein
MTITDLKNQLNITKFNFFASKKEGWHNAWINLEMDLSAEDGEIVRVQRLCVGIHDDVAKALVADPNVETLDLAKIVLTKGEKYPYYGLTQICLYNKGEKPSFSI